MFVIFQSKMNAPSHESRAPKNTNAHSLSLLPFVLLSPSLEVGGKRAFGSEMEKGMKYDLAYCGTFFTL